MIVKIKFFFFEGGVIMYKTKNEILIKSKEAIGKTFGEIDLYDRLANKKNKGNLGQIIEESFFEYNVNSRSEPDFVEAGVELKVTPFKLNKNKTYSSKERLVLNLINYMNEGSSTFYTSSFMKKNSVMLLMFYLYDFDTFYENMKIEYTYLFEFSEEDLIIVKNDWEIIHNKILNGLAHEISEGDTMYLAACRKGNKHSKLRKQPYSEILAPPRAYSLKGSFMTTLLNDKVIGRASGEKIIKDISVLENKSFSEYIYEKLSGYNGHNVDKLNKQFNINSKAKNSNSLLVAKLLGLDGSISKSSEFLKAKIKVKTIRISRKGCIKEHMSFPNFKYKEIIKEKWETSSLREMFETTKWLFVIFKESSEGFLFERVLFWNMPINDLDLEYRKVWSKTFQCIEKGDIYNYTNSRNQRVTYFPKAHENRVGHVRPKGIDSRDCFDLPVEDKKSKAKEYAKQCFWLNNKYIESIILVPKSDNLFKKVDD